LDDANWLENIVVEPVQKPADQPLPQALHWVLVTVFLGLLGFMLGSGLAALHDLDRMHATEQSARRVLADRSEQEMQTQLDAIRHLFASNEMLDSIQLELLRQSDELRAWNDRQLRATDQTMVAQFSELQGSLTESIVFSLASGFFLIAASMLYILRLERQMRGRYAELARSRGELEQLSARLVDAQETERRNISRELHDEVGQTLGALLVDAGRLSAALPDGQPEIQEQVRHMKSVAERAVQSVRNLALLLRPGMLDDLGLVPALEWQGREVSRSSQIEVEVQSENVAEDLRDDYKVTIYRLVQEALNNAVRHSGAHNARVRVEQEGLPTAGQSPSGSRSGGGRIVVTVSDDGHGFDPRRQRGLGILGMEERVRRMGGALSIESHAGQGTTVRAGLPI
jgi:signal transduction histidine kinase